MTTVAGLEDRIGALFLEKLNIEVPSSDTDLIETGAIDSVAFVDLLLQIEREFGIQVSVDDLDLGRFRSVAAIAEFIAGRLEQPVG